MKTRATITFKRKDHARFGGAFLATALLSLVALVLLWRELRVRVIGVAPGGLPAAGETALILGLVILGSWLAGRLIRRIALPPITGQLLFGLIVGPELWKWLDHPEFALIGPLQLSSLDGAASLAVVMIGLVAGAEIDAKFLREKLKAVIALAAGQVILVTIGVGIVSYLLLGSFAYAMIVATVAATCSSAVSVALLRAMRHPTDFARLLLATTVAKDLFLVVAFSVVLFLVAATTLSTYQPWYWIVLHLAGSIAVGCALAWPMRLALARIERNMTAVVLLTAICLAILCRTIGIAPLITAITLGYTARNLAPIATASFFATARRLFLAVCCVFFAVAGAHLDLAALVANWGIVFAISGTRLAGIWIGATLAARVARLSPIATRWVWAGFVPQAGISLALAAQILVEFPNQRWAVGLTTIVVACITLNEIVGPVLMRIALRRVPSDGL